LSYRVEMTRRAKKSLARIATRDVEPIARAVQRLGDEPLPRGASMLIGAVPPLWRIRVGEYRIMYSIAEARQIVIVEQITRRNSQTYERLP
jgi:mRNA interferase RelE/StbE